MRHFAALLIALAWAVTAAAEPFASNPLACDLAARTTQGDWKPLTLPDGSQLEWRVGMYGEDLRSIHLRYPDGAQGHFLAGPRVIRCGDAFPQDAIYILFVFKNAIISEASHWLRMPGFSDRLGRQIDAFAESLQAALKARRPRS